MRVRFAALFLASASAVALAFACSPAPDQEPAAAADESAIINGQADTTHSAVVALLGRGLCSGTIIKKDVVNKIGWVLTAAHCVGSSGTAYETTDFQVRPASLRYQVIDVVGHPGFSGSMLGGGHDFAVVRIAGVGPDTPVIPIEEENDPTAIGDMVTSVGFGKTAPNDTANSKRNSVTKPVHDLDDKFVVYEQTQNGICSGDSGGPVIRGTGANARVVGVHSFVMGRLPDGGAAPSICMGMAVSGRPKSDLDFIRGELNKPLPAASCSLCSKIEASNKNECAQLVDKCLDNEDCANYSRCIRQATGVDGGAPPPLADGGVPPTTAECASTYPRGEGPYKAATTCSCVRSGCNQACAAEPKCANVPKCGIALPTDSCTTCMESKCCAEEQACAADSDCYLCLKNGDASNPACATMALRTALKTCTVTNCAASCSTDGGTGSSSGGSSGGTTDAGSSGSSGSSSGSSGGSGYDAGSSSGGSSSGKSSSGTTSPDEEEEEDPVGSVDENTSSGGSKSGAKPSPKKPAPEAAAPVTTVEPSCAMSTSSSSTSAFGLAAIVLGLTFLGRRRRNT